VSDAGAPGRIRYVGHSTVLVDLDGVRLLTDPLLRSRVAHLRRRSPVDTSALRGIDAVLVSHAHYDHLDLPSLEKLGKKVPVVVPRGLAGLLRKRRFETVVEVEEGETFRIGELAVRAVPAEHAGGRGPLGASAAALGYVVSGSTSVYFAGDTDLFDGMADLGDLDVGLIPVWGWGPTLGKGGHLDPKRAAEAVRRLAVKIAVPIHWGTYFPIHLGIRRVPPFVELPPAEFAAACAEVAPDVTVRVLQPGEELLL
jgi:L-ascorbate metabolism protein UlaG (beta-lactamase superfamily)